MPSLGADMIEGTVTRWLVKPGDHVKRGDIVVEIETDKADMEVEIFESGTIDALLVPEGERVAVGTPLAIVTTAAGAQAAAQPVPPPVAPAPITTPPPAAPPPISTAPAAPAVRATPTAKVLARDLGVDLAAIPGTGVGGAAARAAGGPPGGRGGPPPPAPPPPAPPPRPRRGRRGHPGRC